MARTSGFHPDKVGSKPIDSTKIYSAVAQLVERKTVNFDVPRSSRGSGARNQSGSKNRKVNVARVVYPLGYVDRAVNINNNGVRGIRYTTFIGVIYEFISVI